MDENDHILHHLYKLVRGKRTQRNSWLKNPTIWLAGSILAYISGPWFSWIWDLHRNTINNINFHSRTTNSVKINNQIFHQIQKNLFFLTISRILGAKRFSEKIQYCHNRFLAPCQNLKKTKYSVPRWKDRRKDGRTDTIL